MKPKLFRLNDLWLMAMPLTIIFLVCFALGWNVVSEEGEAIPIRGWVISGVAVLFCLYTIFWFYWERRTWIKTWAYNVWPGIDCYYKGFEVGQHHDIPHFKRSEIGAEIDRVLDKWRLYFEDDPEMRTEPFHELLNGTQVHFRPEKWWTWKPTSYAYRKVVGLAGWNWCMVGTGGKPIEKTAFGHEISHVLLNQLSGEVVDEDKAHEIFKKIGV